MKEKKRIPTSGEPIVWTSPFTALKHVKLPSVPYTRQRAESHALTDAKPARPTKNRGRVDIICQTAHRGGKTVTVVTGFTGIGQAEKETLAKKMQTACGAGGTVKNERIEIQGDQREVVARILSNAGFQPVFAGG